MKSYAQALTQNIKRYGLNKDRSDDEKVACLTEYCVTAIDMGRLNKDDLYGNTEILAQYDNIKCPTTNWFRRYRYE